MQFSTITMSRPSSGSNSKLHTYCLFSKFQPFRSMSAMHFNETLAIIFLVQTVVQNKVVQFWGFVIKKVILNVIIIDWFQIKRLLGHLFFCIGAWVKCVFEQQNKTGMGLLIVLSECVKTLKVLQRKNIFGRFGSKDRISVEGGAQIAASLYQRDTTEVLSLRPSADWPIHQNTSSIQTHRNTRVQHGHESLKPWWRFWSAGATVAPALPIKPPHWLDIQNKAAIHSTWTLLKDVSLNGLS